MIVDRDPVVIIVDQIASIVMYSFLLNKEKQNDHASADAIFS